MKSLSRLDRKNKVDRDYSYLQILSLVCLLKYHVTILEHVQRWRVSSIRSAAITTATIISSLKFVFPQIFMYTTRIRNVGQTRLNNSES